LETLALYILAIFIMGFFQTFPYATQPSIDDRTDADFGIGILIVCVSICLQRNLSFEKAIALCLCYKFSLECVFNVIERNTENLLRYLAQLLFVAGKMKYRMQVRKRFIWLQESGG
jgi:hypothetical protein